MIHPLIKKILAIASKTLVYISREGVACPFCKVKLSVASTYYRDKTCVKRSMRCPLCEWTFSSVEQLRPENQAVRITANISKKEKPCKVKNKKR